MYIAHFVCFVFAVAGSPDTPQITTSVADQVFTATPTAILTADGLPVSVQDHTLPLKTTQIVTIVQVRNQHSIVFGKDKKKHSIVLFSTSRN